MQGRMPGNVMGTPHSNNNYPVNPQNNSRKEGGGGQSNNPRTGDKLSITSEKGLPGQAPLAFNPRGALGAPYVARPAFRRPR